MTDREDVKLMGEMRFTENDIDRLFRTADFGIRRAHKDELEERLFDGTNDELSVEELYCAAGGNKLPDDPTESLKD